jgi:hypothetical protein
MAGLFGVQGAEQLVCGFNQCGLRHISLDGRLRP